MKKQLRNKSSSAFVSDSFMTRSMLGMPREGRSSDEDERDEEAVEVVYIVYYMKTKMNK